MYPGKRRETEAVIAAMEQRGLRFSLEKTRDSAISVRPAVEIIKPDGALELATGIESIVHYMFPELKTVLQELISA